MILMLLLICTVSFGDEMLSNTAMTVSSGHVIDWNDSTSIQPKTQLGEMCAQISPAAGGCQHIYKTFSTFNTSQIYRFSCWGYGPPKPINPQGFADGMLVQSGGWACTPKVTDISNYMNYSFFNPDSAPAQWVPFYIDFVPNSPTMTVIVEVADPGAPACFRDCSLMPIFNNVSTSPTPAPSSVAPSVAPSSVAPSVAPAFCVDCELPSCPGLSIQKEDCSALVDLSQVVSWAQTLASAAEVRSLLCSVFTWEKDTFNCSHAFNRSLFIDVCDILRGAIFSGFTPQFNAKFCMNPTTNFSNTSLAAQPQWNTSVDVNYTIVVNQAPCLETQKYQSPSPNPSFSQYAELGPLADVVAHPEKYPNFPEIKTVSTSRTTQVLFNTACLEPAVVAPTWIGLLVAFLVVALLSCLLLFVRRNRSPVRARSSFLLWSCLFCNVLNFIWISIDQLTGNTTSCGLISFGNLVAFPMLLFVYLIRGLRLLFLYKWAEGNVNNQGWYHAHRKLVSSKTFVLCLSAFFLLCLIIFMATNLADGTFSETFISSGRCAWWDLNQQVIEAASQAGVVLLPTDFNRNGFVPYSVEYSSCIFCSSYGTQVLMCIITVLLLCALIATLILLRKINDQFKLWFELVGVLVALCIVAIVRSIMFFPSAASSMMENVGSDLSALFLAIALFPMLLITSLYPALLTFTSRFRLNPVPSNNFDGQMQINGRISSISLTEVLEDSFGLSLFKQFALESFEVENVTYWSKYKEFEKYQMDDPAREAASIELYETFIRDGSVMEVNVESAMREPYDRMFGGTHQGGTPSITSGHIAATTHHENIAATPTTAPRDVPANAFADITKVVFTLMLTNSWLRFQKSPFWNMLTDEMKKREDESNPITSEGGSRMTSFQSNTHTPHTDKSQKHTGDLL